MAFQALSVMLIVTLLGLSPLSSATPAPGSCDGQGGNKFCFQNFDFQFSECQCNFECVQFLDKESGCCEDYFTLCNVLPDQVPARLIITEIADPKPAAGDTTSPRFVEIFNLECFPVSLDGWLLRRYTNSQPTPDEVDQALEGIIPGRGTYIIAGNETAFINAFGQSPDLASFTGGPADPNGDDNIQLSFGFIPVDTFGVPGADATGKPWEYLDGRAVRNPGILEPKPVFDIEEWTIAKNISDINVYLPFIYDQGTSTCNGNEPAPPPNPPLPPQPFSPPPASECATIGCGIFSPDFYPCACNTACTSFDDCCDDYFDECVNTTCSSLGCGFFNSKFPCTCGSSCTSLDNCCDDYFDECVDTTCSNFGCGFSNPAFPCVCNTTCVSLNNCCDDYLDQCAQSCGDLGCGFFDPAFPCACNIQCTFFNDCCDDYINECAQSCSDLGCGFSNSNLPCTCSPACTSLGNCCDDYSDACPESCAVLGCGFFNSKFPCACNSVCISFDDCCDDYFEECTSKESCSELGCGFFDPSFPCSCDVECTFNGDCCDDYSEVCPQSCEEIGCGVFSSTLPCACNSVCVFFEDCCSDYFPFCAPAPPPPFLDEFQDLIITEIADPGNVETLGNGRFIELFNLGCEDIDLSTGYFLRRFTNQLTVPNPPIPLTGVIAARSTFVAAADAALFEWIYGKIPDQEIGPVSPADSNGDDDVELGFTSPSGALTIIDSYGEFGIDGTGTEAEFKDGRAARLLVTGPSAVWNVSEWDIVTGETGPTLFAPQDYDPFTWALAADLPPCSPPPPPPPSPPAPCPSEPIGDVNGNGQLQVTDVILLVAQLLGEGVVPCPGLTDLFSDGVDNVSDVVVLVGAIVGA